MSTGGRDDKEVGEAAGTQKYQGDTGVAGKGEERPPDGGVSRQDYTFWSPKPPFPGHPHFSTIQGLWSFQTSPRPTELPLRTALRTDLLSGMLDQPPANITAPGCLPVCSAAPSHSSCPGVFLPSLRPLVALRDCPHLSPRQKPGPSPTTAFPLCTPATPKARQPQVPAPLSHPRSLPTVPSAPTPFSLITRPTSSGREERDRPCWGPPSLAFL